MSNQLGGATRFRPGRTRKRILSPAPDAPIHKLPAELLLNVFDEVLRPIKKSRYYSRLYRLMLVTSGWASLIERTSKFWSFAEENRPDRLPLILERSDPGPISIESHQMGVDPDVDNALFQASHRWKSVQIRQAILDSEGNLQRRLGSGGIPSAPMLESFCVTGRKESSKRPVWNLFSGHAPRLETLRLNSFHVLFESPVFDNLRTLELTTIDTTRSSWGSLFDMLQRCRELVTLEMRNLHFARLPNEDEENIIIELPNLISFHIRQFEQEHLMRILSIIRMPRCREIFVHGFMSEALEDIPRRSALPHLVAAIESIFKAADQVALALEEGTFRFTPFTSGKKILDFFGGLDEDSLLTFDVVRSQWGLAELSVPVEIRLRFEDDVDVEPLFTTLRSLSHVTTIVLFQLEEHVVQNILHFLGSPYLAESDGALKWHCPNLENLLTSHCGTSENTAKYFLRFVNNRYGGYEGRSIERPKRLKFIKMTSGVRRDAYPRKDVRALRNAIEPEGKLAWNPKVREPFLGISRDPHEERIGTVISTSSEDTSSEAAKSDEDFHGMEGSRWGGDSSSEGYQSPGRESVDNDHEEEQSSVDEE